MSWCCCDQNGPKWKREVVRDHKFDFVDLDEFYSRSCFARIGYLWVYILIIKSSAVYLADLWTAISLLALDNQLYAKPVIPTEASKWIFLASIIVSYLLLVWDIAKARKIIASRDISYAFTSIIASRYYSVRNYRYYCLFRKIDQQLDPVPFFVFFTLKGWKRLLLAEAPRQVINIVTLAAMVPRWIQIEQGTVRLDNQALGKDIAQQIMTGTMAFSILIFSISFILVCVAAILYIPLLCHIQGNLKEYCCHKVDKRIAEMLRRQARKRTAKDRGKLPQPTLPDVDMYYHHPEYSQSDRVGLMAHAQGQPCSIPPSSPYHYYS